MSNLKIGQKIKAKRRERELTQEELANILGVTKAAVSKWIRPSPNGSAEFPINKDTGINPQTYIAYEK